jgi:hypothetical protein
MKDFVTEQVQELMSWVVPDAEECRRTAEEMLARQPGAPREELARELVRYAQKRAAAVGGVTGLAASPIAMVPAALADIAAVLKIEGTMVGGVAALLDPTSLADPARFRADVLAVVFPAAVSQALRQLGVRAGEQFGKALVRRMAGKGGLESLSKLAGKVLGAKLTGKALATKGVPLVGLGIGAGWNWLEASVVGRRAIAYHTGQPIGEEKLAALGRRLLPARWRGKPSEIIATEEETTNPDEPGTRSS